MRTQIPNKIYSLFDDLIKEYSQENSKFQSNPTEYIKNSDFIIGGTINPSCREEYDALEDRKSKGLKIVFQLHKSFVSTSITREIAELLDSSNQLKCEDSEIISTVDSMVFKFLNDLAIESSPLSEDKAKSLLKSVIEDQLTNLRKSYALHEFKFPIHVIGLDKMMRLNKSLCIEKINDPRLSDKDLEQYMYSRNFEPNFFIHVSTKSRSTYSYAKTNAIRAKEATINILKLLYGCDFGDSCWLSPIINEKDNNPHVFSYFLSGECGYDLFDNRSYSTQYNIEEYENFWEKIVHMKTSQAKLHELLFSIPELILNNRDVNKTVGYLVERSLRWYSDAINEEDHDMAIVKLTIALEALLNFKSDTYNEKEEGLKEIFVRRVGIVNQIDSETSTKADEIYRARCSVSHGEHLTKGLSFNEKQFVARTILLCIQKFSTFKERGLDEKNFSKSLPHDIDSTSVTSGVDE
ncbi:hypothetical protein BCS98_06200 [Vibrio breoganii]|uniref:HEPN domain-containing protein n=1 Tax=Vibrio breoganii TaxID=553239 RepID=UPI000C83F3B7|nr:HEPN domain-containing protein [Vibrio breoganii]PMM89950.1 hypothetical protein BCT44_15830 [Vibrio breoganii]PMO93573.1 hypothetical protein BCS98_06200 [Vibrio breoganii]